MSYHYQYRATNGIRSQNRKRRKLLHCCILFTVYIALVCYARLPLTYLRQQDITDNDGSDSRGSRRLLQTTVATYSEHHEGHFFEELQSCTMEKNSGVPDAWLILHIFIIILSFIGLAVICDDYFVVSLEVICERLSLSEDVAGATFMAAGSSAPELFTALASVTAKNDVGVGTIVGSAVFNILIIIALSAALAKKILKVDWRPLMRDSVIYAISIIMFIVFSIDLKIEIYEAALLIIMYLLYVLLMKFNPQLMKLLAGQYHCCKCGSGPRHNRITPSNTPEVNNDNEKHAAPNNAKSSELLAVNNDINQRTSQSAHSLSIKTASSVVFSEKHENKEHHEVTNGNSVLHDEDNPAIRGVGSKLMLPKINQKPGDSLLATTINDGPAQLEKKPLPPLVNRQTKSVENGVSESVKEVDPKLSEKDIESNGKNHACQKLEAIDKERGSETEDIEDDDEDNKYTITVCKFMPSIQFSLPSKPEPDTKCICWRYFMYVLKWILVILSFPFNWIFAWTVPNCTIDKNKKYYMVTFIMSIVWIAALSFVLVILVSRTGCIINVGDFTMGLVIVAIGTSIPDALSSVFAARDGHADMAVSNAIGSNIFDINLGLGLPYLIRILIDNNRPYELTVQQNGNMLDLSELWLNPYVKFGIILLIILIMVLVVFVIVKFRLNRFVGCSLVFFYAIFLAYAFVQDAVCNYNC